jgi:hypothetical protein
MDFLMRCGKVLFIAPNSLVTMGASEFEAMLKNLPTVEDGTQG